MTNPTHGVVDIPPKEIEIINKCFSHKRNTNMSIVLRTGQKSYYIQGVLTMATCSSDAESSISIDSSIDSSTMCSVLSSESSSESSICIAKLSRLELIFNDELCGNPRIIEEDIV